MRVIAVDTSSERTSVALVDEGAVRGEVRLVTAMPSVAVLPALEFLLRSAGIGPADVEGYAVVVGPGSFTGVRVGLGTVQGLALGSGRPCVGVSTLDVLAAGIVGEGDRLVAMVDAYRDEVFVGRYDREAEPLGPPSREAPADAIASLPAGGVVTGDGALRHEAAIRSRATGVRIVPQPFLAATLGRVGERLLRAGHGIAAAELRPLYLRDADIRPSRP